MKAFPLDVSFMIDAPAAASGEGPVLDTASSRDLAAWKQELGAKQVPTIVADRPTADTNDAWTHRRTI